MGDLSGEGVSAQLRTNLLDHPLWSRECEAGRAVVCGGVGWCGVIRSIVCPGIRIITPLHSLDCIICFLFLSATSTQCQPRASPGYSASVLISAVEAAKGRLRTGRDCAVSCLGPKTEQNKFISFVSPILSPLLTPCVTLRVSWLRFSPSLS